MDDTDRALNALKAQMSEEQRKDMADLLQAELARREKEKMNKTMPKHKSGVKSSSMSGRLDSAGVGELYDDVEKNIRELRLRKLERELAAAKDQQKRLGKFSGGAKASLARAQSKFRSEGSPVAVGATRPPFPLKNFLLLGGIVALGGLKIMFSSGAAEAPARPGAKAVAVAEAKVPSLPQLDIAADKEPDPQARAALKSPQPAAAFPNSANLTEADRTILGELDARRVELEQRNAMLQRREAEVEKQTKILAERMAELNGLTAKLAELRKDKDNRYEARLEQLANVYGSMAPNEAAPLIGKLDDEVALGLLQRMPEKRMGQILGMMQSERAIELTRFLTDRGKL